ncbi:MAG: NADH-quinone oxidoreductase subunit J [Nitrospirae bacterium]|nr:NADH-quinone oxidoreductase subunit J [Nitrospirota bacterium]
MNDLFYISAVVAVISTGIVITKLNVVHALLYLIVSLLAVAMVFLSLGAPFVAALEVIIYGGAIMVLFVFVIMLLNLGPEHIEEKKQYVGGQAWLGPVVLAGILIAELVSVFVRGGGQVAGNVVIEPKQTGIALYSIYLIGVELASMLLLSGLIGAYHLGRKDDKLDAGEDGGGQQ